MKTSTVATMPQIAMNDAENVTAYHGLTCRDAVTGPIGAKHRGSDRESETDEGAHGASPRPRVRFPEYLDRRERRPAAACGAAAYPLRTPNAQIYARKPEHRSSDTAEEQPA
jgi:hypothetical protein